jgi:hypothetical protein
LPLRWASRLLSPATNILSEEYRAAHDDYADADADVEIVGACSDCPCKQGNSGSKQSHLYVGHGVCLSIGLNRRSGLPGTRGEVGRRPVPHNALTRPMKNMMPRSVNPASSTARTATMPAKEKPRRRPGLLLCWHNLPALSYVSSSNLSFNADLRSAKGL